MLAPRGLPPANPAVPFPCRALAIYQATSWHHLFAQPAVATSSLSKVGSTQQRFIALREPFDGFISSY